MHAIAITVGVIEHYGDCKEGLEFWLILVVYMYRIFFIDFMKQEPVSNFRLKRSGSLVNFSPAGS